MIKILVKLVPALLVIINISSYAAPNNEECRRLVIELTASTGVTCTFEHKKIHSGFIEHGKKIPKKVGSKTEYFSMQQNAHEGPSIKLRYVCNGEKVEFKSIQDFCKLKAGDVFGQVLRGKAKYTVKKGNYWDNKPGHIMWLLGK